MKKITLTAIRRKIILVHIKGAKTPAQGDKYWAEATRRNNLALKKAGCQ